MPEDLSDHDLLIRKDERVEALRKLLNDHLHEHRRLIWLLVGALVTTAVAALTEALMVLYI